MKRRSFLTGMAGAGLAATTGAQAQGEAPRPGGYYEFRFFRMTQGDRPRLLSQTVERLLPLLSKHKFPPSGFFDVLIGPESPTFVELLSYASLAEREDIFAKLARDPEFQKALAEFEAGSEPPVLGVDSFIARATPYSPELKPAAAEQKPRLFELRIYHSPTHRQLTALHERFSGPEITIFHRCGIHPVLYGQMAIGRDMPNLVYLTPFESLAAREKAWAAFGADPEWQKVRAESIQRSGQVVSNVSVTMLRATAYSPIR